MVFLFEFKSAARRDAAGKETTAAQKNDPINTNEQLLSAVREAVYSVKGVGRGNAVVTMDDDVLGISLSPEVSKEYSLKVRINKALIEAVNSNPNSIYQLEDSGWLNIKKFFSGDSQDMVYRVNKKSDS